MFKYILPILFAPLMLSSNAKSLDDWREYPLAVTSETNHKFWWVSEIKKADLNHDGIADIIYVGAHRPDNINITGDNSGGMCGGVVCSGVLPGPVVYLSQADGSFKSADHLFVDYRKQPGISLGRRILLEDFNADGTLDVYVVDHGLGTHNGFRDSYYLSQKNGTWVESSNTHLSDSNFVNFNHDSVTGDIDNDGDTDIVMNSLDGKLYCWINQGSGQFNKRTCGSVNKSFSLALGDFNNDGFLDIVTGGHEYENDRTAIIFNDKQGNFNYSFFKSIELPKINEWGTIPDINVVDLDADGDLDIVLSRSRKLYVGAAIQLLFNQGNNQFDSKLHIILDAPIGFIPTHEGNEWNGFVNDIIIVDVNSDRLPDLLLTVSAASGHGQRNNGSVLINQGSMKFNHILMYQPDNPFEKINYLKYKK
jgi:hypothetical protein